MHPKLAIRFAQWLDVNFAIWCDEQIDKLLFGKKETKEEFKRARHESAVSYKFMSEMLYYNRLDEGKETKSYHYSNEALLLNDIVFGMRKGVNRDSLTFDVLDMLAKLELRNAMLIAKGMPYQERKKELNDFALRERGHNRLTKQASICN